MSVLVITWRPSRLTQRIVWDPERPQYIYLGHQQIFPNLFLSAWSRKGTWTHIGPHSPFATSCKGNKDGYKFGTGGRRGGILRSIGEGWLIFGLSGPVGPGYGGHLAPEGVGVMHWGSPQAFLSLVSYLIVKIIWTKGISHHFPSHLQNRSNWRIVL